MITRTEISPGKAPFAIEHTDRILTIGSCFADMIGERFQYFRFNALSNPFGTAYNPVSIFQLLQISLNKRYNPLPVSLGEIWYDHQFHSDICSLSAEELHSLTNEKIGAVRAQLMQASFLVITFGSAWAYRHLESDRIVNNCHKQPGHRFRKELLTVKHIMEDFEVFYAALKELNPHIKIILTVSPVRHIKDTLPLNSVSKANLLSAAYYICEEYADCVYFPAYELLIDDLRDYRYYDEDLLHPSAQAETYIWNKLAGWAFSPALQDAMKEWDALQRMLHHKAFHPSSAAHQQFLKETIHRFQQFTYWDTSQEVISLQTQLL